ncbi:GNAT family N-acetyltransferase [Bacillus mangrovi]|uniref:GNAT family N-acetyltransferase n=1 Tax=Metabacillus mangrovi TaxID=1491830 RepID=A0A7X2S7F7_9BACI|nr:GNAT family N-acetyltransferase [Metabacillus mangrovi]MTH54596.1 GNAT family N-acetyltransferase [Metabacillus mangrovi]
MFEIKQIQSAEAILLRHRVISPDSPVDEARYSGDDLTGTIHIGAYAKDRLVGTASFFKEPHKKLSGENMYRLRGLAIDPAHRNELRGQTLILFGENLLAQNGIDLLWCTTKISNLPYYQHLGFQETSYTFNDGEKGIQVLLQKHM